MYNRCLFSYFSRVFICSQYCLFKNCADFCSFSPYRFILSLAFDTVAHNIFLEKRNIVGACRKHIYGQAWTKKMTGINFLLCIKWYVTVTKCYKVLGNVSWIT